MFEEEMLEEESTTEQEETTAEEPSAENDSEETVVVSEVEQSEEDSQDNESEEPNTEEIVAEETAAEESTEEESSDEDGVEQAEDTTAEEYTEERIAQLKGKIEAALFVTGKPLQLDQLAEIVEADKDLTEMATVELIQDYAFRQDCALEIDDTDGYILQIREEHADVVNKMMPLELSAAVVRTLSAIAIKSPILQSDLIELRGSTAYDHIGDLLARKLISKRRKGRSFMLNTTDHFDQYFKLMGDKSELEHLVKQLGKDDKASDEPIDDEDSLDDDAFEQEAV